MGEAKRGRLQDDLLDRFRTFSRRVLNVAGELERNGAPRRVVDQLIGAGTSPGAQIYEAREAMSRADFLKSLAIAAKELNEARYWMLLVSEMEWISAARLSDLLDEAAQLQRILRAIIINSRLR